MARFAIQGLRPGETLYASSGRFQTSENDGGVNLSEKQRATLEAAGHVLVPVGIAQKRDPNDEQKQALANAERTIAENREAATKADSARVPAKDKVRGRKAEQWQR